MKHRAFPRNVNKKLLQFEKPMLTYTFCSYYEIVNILKNFSYLKEFFSIVILLFPY